MCAKSSRRVRRPSSWVGLAGLLTLVALLPAWPTAANAADAVAFAPPKPVGTGHTVAADFDHDGQLDLAASDGSLLIGEGDGTFVSGKPWAPHPVRLLTVADMNGDGAPDIAAVVGADNSTPNGALEIYLNDRAGGFRHDSSNDLTLPGDQLDIVAGDVNGDGTADLVVTEANNGRCNCRADVEVLYGDGQGGIGGRWGIETDPSTGYPDEGAYDAAIVDWNGDGLQDVVYTYSTYSPTPGQSCYYCLRVVLNQNGEPRYLGIPGSQSHNLDPRLAVGSFTNDGRQEVALTDGDSHLVIARSGWSATSPISQTGGGYVDAAADFNGDGKLDLAFNDSSASATARASSARHTR